MRPAPRSRISMLVLTPLLLIITGAAIAGEPFRITVIDAETKRGVPLVELTMTNSTTFITDSAGVIAFDEPGLMNQRVHFTVKAHGYEYPKDGFGIAGRAIDITPGGAATLEVNRINIAERMYRLTGQGIYRDSVIVGDAPPTANPVLNGLVMGQDSIQNAFYKGTLYWFWGDTGRVAYPLGNFHMSGATSLLPEQGGLDPEVGVNLRYFVDENGFSKRMCPIDKPGPVWLDGFMVMADQSGEERMLAHFIRVKTLGEIYEQGLAQYNDRKEIFEPIKAIDVESEFVPHGHPFNVSLGGSEYFYFPSPFPAMRAPSRYEDVLNPEAYESFTCIENGEVVRNEAGQIVYEWRRGEARLTTDVLRAMIDRGELDERESWIQLRDVETGDYVWGHGGSIYWNEFRQRWVMIALQTFGKPSMLGEIWCAEGDTPLGPWVYARRVVTHDNYSFYNPKSHPLLDQDGGRTIYFEGTYTAMFANNPHPTPRYDYNQIMYRLRLDDPRLALPAPVYAWRDREGGVRYGARRALVAAQISPDKILGVPFYAIPPDRPTREGTTAIAHRQSDNEAAARLAPANETESGDGAVFFAWPADAAGSPPETTPLFECVNPASGEVRYIIENDETPQGFERAARPVCLVWPNPMARAVTAAIIRELPADAVK